MMLLEQPRRRRHPTSRTRSHLRGNTGVAEVAKAATSKLQSEGPPSMRIGFFSESAMAFNAMPNPQALARAPIPICLNSTTFRVAVKDVAAMVPDDSPGAGVAGTTSPPFVSLPRRWPLLGAKDGGCNAPVAVASPIAFSTSTKNLTQNWKTRGTR